MPDPTDTLDTGDALARLPAASTNADSISAG
jgi:hypothetical protein